MSSKLPAETRIGRVALRVNDLDEVTGFYRDAVGLSVQERTGNGATLGADGDALLELRADPEAAPRESDATGLFHTAFRVPGRAALGDALGRLPELAGVSDHLVSEALYASDPEGNGVEIYRDRPRAEWPDAPDGEVRMDTLPLDVESLRADAGGADTAPADTDIGHVHLEVSSLADTAAFYGDGLGFGVTQRMRGALFLAAGGYHHHVGANVWHGCSKAPAGRGLDWVELRMPADGLDAARERLSNAGHAVRDGTVRDPDGIELRLRREP